MNRPAGLVNDGGPGECVTKRYSSKFELHSGAVPMVVDRDGGHRAYNKFVKAFLSTRGMWFRLLRSNHPLQNKARIGLDTTLDAGWLLA